MPVTRIPTNTNTSLPLRMGFRPSVNARPTRTTTARANIASPLRSEDRSSMQPSTDSSQLMVEPQFRRTKKIRTTHQRRQHRRTQQKTKYRLNLPRMLRATRTPASAMDSQKGFPAGTVSEPVVGSFDFPILILVERQRCQQGCHIRSDSKMMSTNESKRTNMMMSWSATPSIGLSGGDHFENIPRVTHETYR